MGFEHVVFYFLLDYVWIEQNNIRVKIKEKIHLKLINIYNIILNNYFTYFNSLIKIK